MGVTGLWPILQPCARPTPLPTLNRKRLAVDASIWIYQFLKAVRDKEGNALRNSHIVGFFRRICKLLFFGIKPVFVFDGGAPALKRQTIQGRKRRREGRREDALRTAGKLLAVQLQKRGEEEAERRKKERERAKQGLRPLAEDQDAVTADQPLVYVEEMGMDAQQRAQTRKFKKTDAYHLPELDHGIEDMGQPNDPRIMSAAELEEYARQFHNGEDVNLYDFSKIDFNGEFFMSLPAVDRYNILNAARLRSRLRMGLSKEQLDEMFPDRMAFSRFQIDRVRERNELTQRLMHLSGMNTESGMMGVGSGRIAGERDREYVLVKNDGVEGGWALGVVSTDRSVGERNKPIDVEEWDKKPQGEEEDEESEDEFEDVPVEGLNRLPKIKGDPPRHLTYGDFQAQEVADQRRELYASRNAAPSASPIDPTEQDTLFVDEQAGGPSTAAGRHFNEEEDDLNRAIALSLQKDHESEELDEEEHLNRAIALSLQKNHGNESESDGNAEFGDTALPEYEQRAVQAPKPLTSSSGRMVAHIVNNRANAAVPKPRAASISSDSDMDLQSALAKARREKAPEHKRRQPAPIAPNTKNPFDGPLPFERIEFRTSIFGKRNHQPGKSAGLIESNDEDLAGGFAGEEEEETSRPLPPWLAGNGDIRSQVQEQQKIDKEVNAEDQETAAEEERVFRRDNAPIEIQSSDDDSDVEIIDAFPLATTVTNELVGLGEDLRTHSASNVQENIQSSVKQESALEEIREAAHEKSDKEVVDWSESDYGDTSIMPTKAMDMPTDAISSRSKSASPEFEDVEVPLLNGAPETHPLITETSPSPLFEDVDFPDATTASPQDADSISRLPIEDSVDQQQADRIGDDVDFDDFSDPDDEELLAQLAMEAEEHARFASTLNNKSERENQVAYEEELKTLRSQQKKDRRDADEVSLIMVTECQALLRLFGIPYITAPMEAEAQCAELVRLGLVDGVVTDDSDIFLFGGTRVYKNMFNSNKFVECYLASDIEKELSLSRDPLISIAQLLGSDYTDGLPGVGPVTAVEILSEFPNPSTGLEEFKAWWSSIQTPLAPPLSTERTVFRKKFRRSHATKLFLPSTFPSPAVAEAYLHADVDSTPEPFQWGVPDLDRLRDFLMATVGWTSERTDEVLVPVIRDMNRRAVEGTQANITRFFEGAVGAGVRETTGGKEKGSKRMKDAVDRLKSRKQRGGEIGALSETVADKATKWVKKHSKETEKGAKQKGNGKAKKRNTAPATLNDDSVSDADVDEEELEAPPPRKKQRRSKF
ncbi:uncharacterized protein BP5553_09904 [Venustampulla echinocandica]|uniref:POU-specific domain-containing protein n=1 Tax=Venustampulla echinocandica TaxID=2656787 RepID=A0A370TB06_9HELO|nr:uncharacterized protein BP5553_09904 [Venustampulla echinocandica]RDL31115.1 hypothetical protein BP5553_09904 [Venustampulla echinocandica]